ncbi:hypothetical protein Pme01_09330 [Planosporangium mesophilum]|uniref:Uncharacterized protein n=1 Tax=Planosporangium mesophilum TaxID=689768 RepID=A0A8J3WZ77_9ACTN|nr:hypothetical protein Pme01_09330 [Planosporangium mesophilum]
MRCKVGHCGLLGVRGINPPKRGELTWLTIGGFVTQVCAVRYTGHEYFPIDPSFRRTLCASQRLNRPGLGVYAQKVGVKALIDAR